MSMKGGIAITWMLVVASWAWNGHAASAWADPPPQLLITSARVDPVGERIEISGVNFGEEPPQVSLASSELAVESAAPTQIVAVLPPGLEPGTYLLTVSRGPARTQFDAFNLTIGAVGPTGPPGPVGPGGLRGLQEFVSPGTFTFEVPPGVTRLMVELSDKDTSVV